MKKMALSLGFMLVVMCFIWLGCVGYVGAPYGVAVEENMGVYYDDPARGWFVEGYWTGGYPNGGVWVAPFWTTDVVVLNKHFGHYHGHHQRYFKDNINRHIERRRHDQDYQHQRPQVQQQRRERPQVQQQQREGPQVQRERPQREQKSQQRERPQQQKRHQEKSKKQEKVTY